MTDTLSTMQLIAELNAARQRVAGLESALAARRDAAHLPTLDGSGDDLDVIAQALGDFLTPQEEKFRLAMEATTDGLWDWYCGENRTYYSPGYYRMLGYQPAEFPQTPQAWLEIVHPDDRDLLITTDRDCVENRIQSFEIELRLKNRAGDWQWVLSRGKAISRNADGRALRIIGTHMDITARKQIEEALRQSNTELQTRNEELDAFAHTVAHDLKNPLAAILGFAEVLSTDWADLSNDELDVSFRTIRRSAAKMDNILDELLLFAQVRKSEAELSRLDMTAIVIEARQRLTEMIEKQRAVITLPESWPDAVGNAGWIEEVWVNYLSNAIKYGGQPPHLTLGADEQSDGTVRFQVTDNGPGIAPADQARLFTPFTRLDQARATGHGLGLSIVRRIVEKLGGQVGVDSRPGAGSTFYFTLPRAD
jgi:PAS domain S-box-containing protein